MDLQTEPIGIHLFELLDEPSRRALRAELDIVLVRGGDVIVRQGEQSDALYVVMQGRLRVVDGSGATLGELRRGQSFGEIGLLTDGPRTATVFAVRDTLLARLSRESFDRLVTTHPQAMLRQFAAPVIRLLQEHGGRPRRPQDDVATIAVVPIDEGIAVAAVASQLAEALADSGSTLHLNGARLEETLATQGIAQSRSGDPASIGIVGWLNEMEAAHRYVVYEADAAASAWTERCLRQADRIVLVGDASRPAERGAIERSLLPDDEAFTGAQRVLVLLHPPGTARPSGTRAWLDARRLDAHYHVRRDDRADMARLARLLAGRGVGLVLSGGGAPGFGHIGGVRALREAGVPIDLIGGVSQGGLVACQIAMGWDDETIMAKNRAAVRHRFDYTFPVIALMAGAEMTEAVQEMFGDAQLEDMWIPCFCVTTNLSRATRMVHDRGPVWKYTRATTSIPGLLPPVIDEGEMLVDGGLLTHLPTDVMRERGDCGVVFACDAASPTGPAREGEFPYESSISGWRILWRRLNPFAASLKVPTIGQIMMRMAVFHAAQQGQAARELADFCMRLDLRHYGLLEFGALDEIVAAGYSSAQSTLGAWRDDERFLSACRGR